MKERIKQYALDLGAEDVGIAAVENYKSLLSPDIHGIFPGARSLVVLAFRELSNCESGNKSVAAAGRVFSVGVIDYSTYMVARLLEKDFQARAMIPPIGAYPNEFDYENRERGRLGLVAAVSLRHAAVAAGLGNFGRNNLVLHPRLGSRVLYSAVITDLALPPDPPCTEKLCNGCHQCVESCPASALDGEGRTHEIKCIKNAQPYGLGGYVFFWDKFIESPPEKQKQMIRQADFAYFYQSLSLGTRYYCFNCMTACPL
ncbi:4Fe-4S binding protein [Candidatus Darwinibacter acetoxidans]|jgi:epoxyqueuosine reductase QueG